MLSAAQEFYYLCKQNSINNKSQKLSDVHCKQTLTNLTQSYNIDGICMIIHLFMVILLIPIEWISLPFWYLIILISFVIKSFFIQASKPRQIMTMYYITTTYRILNSEVLFSISIHIVNGNAACTSRSSCSASLEVYSSYGS